MIWNKKIIKILITQDRIKLNVWIKKNYPALTMSHLQKLCRKGEIRINGKRINATDTLTEGDELKLPPFIVEYENNLNLIKTKNTCVTYTNTDIEKIKKSIIYQDKNIIAINKPSGLAVQGGSNILKHVDSLINEAFPEYNNNLRLTHRIDKDTSGILIIAKNYETALNITTLFKEGKIKKTYHAIVYNSFEKNTMEGIINIPITDKNDKTKFATTHYKVLDTAYNLLSLLELQPKTGRMHQLRIHLSSIDHTIVGDFKYGNLSNFSKLKNTLNFSLQRKLYLHAYKIEIEGYPTIKAPYPDHFNAICKYLNF